MEIESLEIEDHEKKNLISLAESHVHHAVIDSILSSLKKEEKQEFLKLLNSKNQEKIWKFLRDKIKDVEEKIEKTASEVKNQLLKDITETKA